MMRKFRWWLSEILESVARRFEWWAECVAPPTDKLDMADILSGMVIEPTDTPFLRSINRKPKDKS